MTALSAASAAPASPDYDTLSVDLAPTVLDWLGRDAPAGMDGRSLLPLLRGDAPADWRDHAVMELDLADLETPTPWQTMLGMPVEAANLAIIRERRWKLVHLNGGLAPLLFDLEADPGEHVNLADDPAQAATLLRLTRRLLDHRMRHADHALSDFQLAAGGTIRHRRPS